MSKRGIISNAKTYNIKCRILIFISFLTGPTEAIYLYTKSIKMIINARINVTVTIPVVEKAMIKVIGSRIMPKILLIRKTMKI